jgi:two-component system, NtrC family, response regulator AtoC
LLILGKVPLPMTRRILIADDDPAVRRALSAVARDLLGMEPRAVADAGAACRALHETRFDAIVTDVFMDGDGRSVVRAARQHCPETPVIMITAMPDRWGREQALALGAADLLAKPFSPEALQAILDRAFAQGTDGSGGEER